MAHNIVGQLYHRPWGSYQTLAITDHYQIKIIRVHPHSKLSLQSHTKRNEHWIVIEGSPMITVDVASRVYTLNEHVYIPIGAKHRLENPTATEVQILEIQTGSYFGEDDIERFADIYGRD